jgi:hypothetical protein
MMTVTTGSTARKKRRKSPGLTKKPDRRLLMWQMAKEKETELRSEYAKVNLGFLQIELIQQAAEALTLRRMSFRDIAIASKSADAQAIAESLARWEAKAVSSRQILSELRAALPGPQSEQSIRSLWVEALMSADKFERDHESDSRTRYEAKWRAEWEAEQRARVAPLLLEHHPEPSLDDERAADPSSTSETAADVPPPGDELGDSSTTDDGAS